MNVWCQSCFDCTAAELSSTRRTGQAAALASFGSPAPSSSRLPGRCTRKVCLRDSGPGQLIHVGRSQFEKEGWSARRNIPCGYQAHFFGNQRSATRAMTAFLPQPYPPASGSSYDTNATTASSRNGLSFLDFAVHRHAVALGVEQQAPGKMQQLAAVGYRPAVERFASAATRAASKPRSSNGTWPAASPAASTGCRTAVSRGSSGHRCRASRCNGRPLLRARATQVSASATPASSRAIKPRIIC